LVWHGLVYTGESKKELAMQENVSQFFSISFHCLTAESFDQDLQQKRKVKVAGHDDGDDDHNDQQQHHAMKMRCM